MRMTQPAGIYRNRLESRGHACAYALFSVESTSPLCNCLYILEFSLSSFKEIDAEFLQAECVCNLLCLVLTKIQLGHENARNDGSNPNLLSFEPFIWLNMINT